VETSKKMKAVVRMGNTMVSEGTRRGKKRRGCGRKLIERKRGGKPLRDREQQSTTSNEEKQFNRPRIEPYDPKPKRGERKASFLGDELERASYMEIKISTGLDLVVLPKTGCFPFRRGGTV